jgi:hypothetical protein
MVRFQVIQKNQSFDMETQFQKKKQMYQVRRKTKSPNNGHASAVVTRGNTDAK